jgi:hypothetical protein
MAGTATTTNFWRLGFEPTANLSVLQARRDLETVFASRDHNTQFTGAKLPHKSDLEESRKCIPNVFNSSENSSSRVAFQHQYLNAAKIALSKLGVALPQAGTLEVGIGLPFAVPVALSTFP